MATRASKALKRILGYWGHDVLLQVRTPDGFKKELEIHTVRHMEPSARLGLIQQEQREGVTHDVDIVYYFLPNSKVKEGDRIYEKDDRYPSGQTTWIVDWAVPVRGAGGKIEYYAVGATRESPN